MVTIFVCSVKEDESVNWKREAEMKLIVSQKLPLLLPSHSCMCVFIIICTHIYFCNNIKTFFIMNRKVFIYIIRNCHQLKSSRCQFMWREIIKIIHCKKMYSSWLTKGKREHKKFFMAFVNGIKNACSDTLSYRNCLAIGKKV